MKKQRSGSSGRRVAIRIAVALAAVGAVLLVARFEKGRGKGRNLLVNAGFEEGERGWQWLSWSGGWAPFTISRDRACEGKASALLKVRSAGDARGTIVWGVVQEVTVSGAFPDCLEGRYYVEGWERGAMRQYMQAVIIDLSKSVGAGSSQIRYILSGVDAPPYNLSNARYVFVDPDRKVQPAGGKWVSFAMNPTRDFAAGWQYTPPSGSRLRVLFEARFDGRKTGDAEARADVFYDGLYLGPSAGGHCGK